MRKPSKRRIGSSEGPTEITRFDVQRAGFARTDLMLAAKVVLWCIVDHYGNNNSCYPSLRTMVTETGMHLSSVMRGIKELEAAAVIQVSRDGRYNRYKLNFGCLQIACTHNACTQDALTLCAECAHPVCIMRTESKYKASLKEKRESARPSGTRPKTQPTEDRPPVMQPYGMAAETDAVIRQRESSDAHDNRCPHDSADVGTPELEPATQAMTELLGRPGDTATMSAKHRRLVEEVVRRTGSQEAAASALTTIRLLKMPVSTVRNFMAIADQVGGVEPARKIIAEAFSKGVKVAGLFGYINKIHKHGNGEEPSPLPRSRRI
jgi:hypothetical protein